MKSQFYLNGQVRLQSIDLTSTQATACIEVGDEIMGDAGNGEPTDQITLECRLPDHLRQRLQRLKRGGRLLEGMTVRFRAIYDRFGFRHPGQFPGDPLNLLGFQCQLDHITLVWWVDGLWSEGKKIKIHREKQRLLISVCFFPGFFYFFVKDSTKEIQMILLSGTLQTGTPSTPALLRCELSVFAVLDERLVNISSGNYPGLFEVETIQPQSLPSEDGTIRLGVAAVLKRFSLTLLGQSKKSAIKKSRQSSAHTEQCTLFTEEDDSSAPQSQLDEISDHAGENQPENTPELDTGVVAEVMTSVLVDQNNLATSEVTMIPQPELKDTKEVRAILTAEDQALFGEGFELSATIQLDATESRERLCQQRDRLKQFGYRFQAQEQVWKREE
jgi:hypothetical protein